MNSRSSSGQPCRPKAVTSPQHLLQRQCIHAVQQQPRPPSPPPVPPPGILPQQIRHPTRATPPLPPSQPLPTPPSHPAPPSKLPVDFQELQQSQSPLLQPRCPRQQQPTDQQESSQKPEELPANQAVTATDQQWKHKSGECDKLFSTMTSLKVCLRRIMATCDKGLYL
ncbi:uncharacterized protein LOC126199151 [Schistocerca nitens]|uniref:uncharacterized protein LOC126199151 n=1 Tax=Schistocerca nitens TaxID=7011 RepID=UPI002119A1F0|nr:uncharacterized protein LOC126199151 [Schistocerca nitens]